MFPPFFSYNPGRFFPERAQRFLSFLGFHPKLRHGEPPPIPSEEELPLRSTLFNADQTEQHGKILAGTHTVHPGRTLDQKLLMRLAENESLLLRVRGLLGAAIKENRRITPAGEWLLDNFYIMEEQIQTGKKHLPKGYSRELPCLRDGPSAGSPRVYDMAMELVSHGDGRVDMDNLTRFLESYQSVSSLKLGELWAIPIMLRLTLIENLRRVAVRIAADMIEQDRAGFFANRMLETVENDPKNLILVIADMAHAPLPMSSAFVAELSRRLQGQGSSMSLPLTWIEQQLSETGMTIHQLVQAETRHQAADQVSVSNSIGSLRFLEGVDWHTFVESMSLVDHLLRHDPGGFYAGMDFRTRDRYRHVVERLARHSSPMFSEDAVVREALQLAQEGAKQQGTADRAAHVGFYLIDKGLPKLERRIRGHFSFSGALRKIVNHFPLLLFFGTILALTTVFTMGLWAQASVVHFPIAVLLLGILPILLSTSHLAISMTNWIVTLLATPSSLPRMDFSKGIPRDARTLVVVPTMLTTPQNIRDLVEDLEVRFLANQDSNLFFALLTDFPDADQETLPGDAVLLGKTQQRIEALNTKYWSPGRNPFFLLHRPRRWNTGEGFWMGYERKRGKLAALNALLRGESAEDFSLVVGDMAVLPTMTYVITLDTDTKLPRDSARQFVGAMAHPLNRPQYDALRQRVVEGYGILQPRMAVSLPSINQSHYARLCGSEPGVDPYTQVVSDVYQDLFQEGSFIGKGIYEVNTFDQVLRGRFPENLILSHDLLEGCYIRCGLLSDALLYEEYPSSYSADVRRRYRWIRGDWQILAWIRAFVPGSGGRRERNPLSPLSRWKILDNLRRSITAPALIALALTGWFFVAPAWLGTLALMGVLLIPSLLNGTLHLFQKSSDMLFRQHLVTTTHAMGMSLLRGIFAVAALPHEAVYSLGAIGRTLWRLHISHRDLLEWTPSNCVDRKSATDLAGMYRELWISPAFAITTALVLGMWHPAALASASILLFLWSAFPAMAWTTSKPMRRRESRLSEEQCVFLRRLSRKTWAFFETFIGPDDHWLPPDNFQEHPARAVAHRTSPTNMGLSLLAQASAYDFGYISAGSFVELISLTFRTMSELKRHRGHFFNWYDTKTLTPLPPLYISTVDSGNLAGHLLTLKPALLALPDHAILTPKLFDGLTDTLEILLDMEGSTSLPLLSQFRKDLEVAQATPPDSLEDLWSCLERLAYSAESQVTILDTVSDSDVAWWSQKLARQCRSMMEECLFFAPWVPWHFSPDELRQFQGIHRIPTLRECASREEPPCPPSVSLSENPGALEERSRHLELLQLIQTSKFRAQKRMETIEDLVQQSQQFARMEYDFLYDEARHLLTIGYNVDERRRDSGSYDLLASEARLCSFVAIAQGQVPQQNWFALGRLLTNTDGNPALLSWSGSMFEYLMPLLVMPTYESTLLDQTYQAVVQQQIAYGKQRDVPWGISESSYHAFGLRLDYQYRAFGVPGLGLKRGLGDDLVIAPYASMLALLVAPEEACRNLQRLASLGLEGRFGFYEAIDYTPSRLPAGRQSAVVKSYMTHHAGMSLLSLSSLLLDRPMPKRFVSEPMFQATLLLLQERIPTAGALSLHATELSDAQHGIGAPEMPRRVLTRPDTTVPEVQLLSNGRYHVMVTNAGGGYSRWKDMAVTRWQEDVTCDIGGSFCYLQDTVSGAYWSTAYHPAMKQSGHYEVVFSEGRAEFRRRDFNIDTHTTMVVSPEDDIELRRICLTNFSKKPRILDITSYAEVILAPQMADALHPAFSKLFVHTEIVPGQQAILCHRRPRSKNEKTPWMVHMMAAHETDILEISYETDRAAFLGRGNSVAHPQSLCNLSALTGHQGSVLDPIVAIRYRISLAPESSAVIDLISGVGETRDDALHLAAKYQDRHMADRVFDLAWTHSQVILRQLNVTAADAQLYGHLAGYILFPHAYLRAGESTITSNRRGQSGLWGYSISGDLPMVLLRIEDASNIDLVRQLVGAQAYWRMKGLAVDLVIWNENRAGYRQILHEQILGLIAAGPGSGDNDRSGSIFERNIEEISGEDRLLIQAVARVIISDQQGTLEDQIYRRSVVRMPVSPLAPTKPPFQDQNRVPILPRHDLLFFNGYGGFTPDGREYVISTARDLVTPAPWAQVLANKHFGTVLSESSLGYTWSENSHEFRLTPWHNDPQTDTSGEALYVRDEESGIFWSPTPLPVRGTTPYATRHGFGYSVFEHTEHGIQTEVWVYVALDDRIKFTAVKIRNITSQLRRVSLTGYTEWVLGDLRQKSSMHVITEIESSTGSLFARNPFHTKFAPQTAFFTVDEDMRSVTCDRTEFIGRNGTLQNPSAMHRVRLSGKVGAALDPCAAIQVPMDLAEGEEREIIFRLGVGRDTEDALALIHRFHGPSAARSALEAVWSFWDTTLGAIQVETSDPALNVLTNGWLMYQVLACRMWARSGYYQSGGAFGFRDQLQDAMALIHISPTLVREHLLLCAAHQFPEGDVLHWWHPPLDQGVRTRCSDDFLWLPLATARYVLHTGDTGVLDEPIRFLNGRPVGPEEDAYYDTVSSSDETTSLYNHCVRAITRGENYGEHGLPLMGSGDWNDGMNLVGARGQGESIWLGFFLYHVFQKFLQIARIRGDESFIAHCREASERLRRNLENFGWDGEWYLRAYFDDGTPLGSIQSDACQIDSIAQSWAVLSGAGDIHRTTMAMDAVNQRLVRRDKALVQLLDPPFDTSSLDPGYIKGYAPGIRENGGQYTHAAIWAAMAFAALNDGEKAWELLDMINPVRHGISRKTAGIYKVEPYVMSADVYASPPHAGCGGWTWYTGSAGWMYRLIVESLMGLRIEGDVLSLNPCRRPHGTDFTVHYRYRETVYHIAVRFGTSDLQKAGWTIDGTPGQGEFLALMNDHGEHWVERRVPARD